MLLTARVSAAPLAQKGNAYVQCHKNIVTSSIQRHGSYIILLLPVPSFWLSLPFPSNCPQLYLLTQVCINNSCWMTAGKAGVSLPFNRTWRTYSHLALSECHSLKPEVPKSSTRVKTQVPDKTSSPLNCLLIQRCFQPLHLALGKRRLSQMVYPFHIRVAFSLDVHFSWYVYSCSQGWKAARKWITGTHLIFSYTPN